MPLPDLCWAATPHKPIHAHTSLVHVDFNGYLIGPQFEFCCHPESVSTLMDSLKLCAESGRGCESARNSRLVITDVSCCPGRVRYDSRQHLSDLGSTCVCSHVDILDFKHGLQKAAAVENFALPPGCKFDITILYMQGSIVQASIRAP